MTPQLGARLFWGSFAVLVFTGIGGWGLGFAALVVMWWAVWFLPRIWRQ